MNMVYAIFALIFAALLLVMRQTFSRMDNWRGGGKH
jgi:hypothetical protein